MAQHHVCTMLRMLEKMHEEFKDLSKRVAACEEHVESRIQQTRLLKDHEKQLRDLKSTVRQVQQLIPAIISTERGRRMAIERLRSHVEGESSGLQEQEVMQAARVDMLGDAHSNLPGTLPELPEGSVNFWQAHHGKDSEVVEDYDPSAVEPAFRNHSTHLDSRMPLDLDNPIEAVKERTLSLTSCGSAESFANNFWTGLEPSEEDISRTDGDSRTQPIKQERNWCT